MNIVQNWYYRVMYPFLEYCHRMCLFHKPLVTDNDLRTGTGVSLLHCRTWEVPGSRETSDKSVLGLSLTREESCFVSNVVSEKWIKCREKYNIHWKTYTYEIKVDIFDTEPRYRRRRGSGRCGKSTIREVCVSDRSTNFSVSLFITIYFLH